MKIFLTLDLDLVWIDQNNRTEATAVSFQKRSYIVVMVPSSPKKGLTFKRSFVHPAVDSKVKPNFKEQNGFR